MDEVIGIFPVPLMRAPAVLSTPAVRGLVEAFAPLALEGNSSSTQLSHTRMLRPQDNPLYVQAAAAITPKLVDFGVHLFGERIGWSIKEMWVNVLDHGGRQAMHNHANSFISGIVYLTEVDPSTCTVFMKSPGGTDFTFRNDHAGTTSGPFNADQWISPQPAPGDLLLFPSYLMHAVPPNAGGRRLTMSFNAIPTRIESWGYTLGFHG